MLLYSLFGRLMRHRFKFDCGCLYPKLCVMLTGMKDESGEQFVAYFLPTEETMTKRDKDRETGKNHNCVVHKFINNIYLN